MRAPRAIALPLVAVAVALVQGPGRAAACDVPEDWVWHAGYGGPSPVADAKLEVVSEELQLRLAWSQNPHYDARADLVVRNDGPEREVRLAVPLQWDGLGVAYMREHAVTPQFAKQEGDRVRITFDGRLVRCEIQLDRSAPATPYGPRWGGDGWTFGRCVASVRVPRRDRIPLRVEVTGFVPSLVDESLRVAYWLAPLGGWQGRIERLRIVADVGPYASLAKVVSPAGARREGRRIVWELTDVATGAWDAVLIQLPTGSQGFPEGYGWSRADARVTVTAGDAAIDALVDGDPATRWCGQAPGTLEARVADVRGPSGQRCAVRDVAFAPDWIDAPLSGDQAPSVAALTISDCANGAERVEVSLPWRRRSGVREEPDHGFVGEAILPAGVLDGPPACLRVGVTQLDPRANGRFCLGELQPRVYCRDEAARRPSLDQARRELYRSPRGR